MVVTEQYVNQRVDLGLPELSQKDAPKFPV